MDTIELKDEKEKQELLAVMKEISRAMHESEVARDQIKEIIDAAHSTFDIPKTLLRKVSRFYHKKNFGVFENEAAEIKNLYAQVTA
jgi:Holliday junction resolvasome RuvABC ATP-dependent DNA helicase subunit